MLNMTWQGGFSKETSVKQGNADCMFHRKNPEWCAPPAPLSKRPCFVMYFLKMFSVFYVYAMQQPSHEINPGSTNKKLGTENIYIHNLGTSQRLSGRQGWWNCEMSCIIFPKKKQF